MRTVAVGIAALMLVGCWRATKTSSTELEKVVSVEGENEPNGAISPDEPKNDDVAAKVRNHKWWKRPLDEGQLDKLVNRIIETNAGNVIYFTYDEGLVGVSEDTRPGLGFLITPAELKGKRYGYYIASGIKRPNRHEVLAALLVELDSREYKQGPGR